MVFYKILFKERERFTGSMALVYSTLVGYSLMQADNLFDPEGEFDYQYARDAIKDLTGNGEYYIDLAYLSVSTLAKKLGMTPQNVRLTLNTLDEKGFIKRISDAIYCPVNLLDEGFFDVPNDTSLKGWQLIDYAFMKDRSRAYFGYIDTWASRLAEMLHTTEGNVYMTIKRLKAKGFLERQKNGKLLVK